MNCFYGMKERSLLISNRSAKPNFENKFYDYIVVNISNFTGCVKQPFYTVLIEKDEDFHDCKTPSD